MSLSRHQSREISNKKNSWLGEFTVGWTQRNRFVEQKQSSIMRFYDRWSRRLYVVDNKILSKKRVALHVKRISCKSVRAGIRSVHSWLTHFYLALPKLVSKCHAHKLNEFITVSKLRHRSTKIILNSCC